MLRKRCGNTGEMGGEGRQLLKKTRKGLLGPLDDYSVCTDIWLVSSYPVKSSSPVLLPAANPRHLLFNNIRVPDFFNN
jgi:hypothetical protein